MNKENEIHGDEVMEEAVSLMKELVGIKSPYFEEDQIMNFVNEWFHQNGMKSYIHEYDDNVVTNFHGKNVVLNLLGNENGPVICLNGHLDTVKLCNGWTKDPYAGILEEDRMYGVGALDMKSGCSAIMLATKRFANKHKNFKGEVIVTLVSDEEGPYGLGTNALIEEGLLDRVDFSIVGEPSATFSGNKFPTVCLGARGGYGLDIEVVGKSAHAAVPEDGLNAAGDAAKIVCALNDVNYTQDELLGKGALCVVGIESDGGACSVPDNAKIKLFWHIVRGENEQTIIDEIDKAVKRANIKCAYHIHFRKAPSDDARGFMPYTVDQNDKYVEEFLSSTEDVCGQAPSIGYLQSIGDFNYLGSRLKAPVVIFGADGMKFHSFDEWASMDSIVKTANTIYDFLEKVLL